VVLLMYLLLTMTTCDSPHQRCTHNTRTCLTPIPLYNTQSIGIPWGPIKETNVVELIEVCLGMFQVSFVDASTADLVGCSVQANDWTSVQGERRGARRKW